MNEPKISVIIPIYNRHDTIMTCIKSIFETMYDNLEIIVIDDCSDKPFDYILEEFPNIILLETESNYGPGVARQIGLNNSTGDWVMFVDSDDYISSKLFTNFSEQIHDDSLDFLVYKTEIIDEDNLHSSLFFPFALHGRIFKNEFLLKNNIKFHPKLRLYEDCYFIKLAESLANNAKNINEVGYYHNKNPNSYTAKMDDWWNKSYDCGVYAMRSVYESYYGIYFNIDDILSNLLEQLLNIRKKYEDTKRKSYYQILDGLNVYYDIFDDETFENAMSKLCNGSDYSNTIDELRNVRKQWLKNVKQIKLSIIIPLYNSHDIIENTLEKLYSVLGEKINQCEIILTDDNSREPWKYDKLELYKNLRVIYSPIRRYMGGNRNRGIENAHGKWIMFLDHDDEITNEWFHLIFGLNQSLNKINIITGQVKGVCHGRCELTHGIFYKREFLIKEKIRFSEKIKTSEDSYFTRLAYLISSDKYGTLSCYKSDKVFYIWKNNPKSTMHKLYNEREYFEEFFKNHIKACILAFEDANANETLKIENYIKLVLDSCINIRRWKKESKNFKKYNIKVFISLLYEIIIRYNLSSIFELNEWVKENLQTKTFMSYNYMELYYKDFNGDPLINYSWDVISNATPRQKNKLKEVILS